MDDLSILIQGAPEQPSAAPVPRLLWRQILLGPATISFVVLALLIVAAILVAPSAGAAGGCGGG
jgi:hypothetical protein